MTLNEAINWFRLDATTVNEASLKTAYWRLAKEFHPDTKNTYIDKMAAHDNFIVAGEAKEMISEALRQGVLPTNAERTVNNYDDDNGDYDFGAGNQEGYNNQKNNDDNLPDREMYDFHHPRPLENLMGMPFVGPIITLVVGCGSLMGMFAVFVVVSPLFASLYLLAIIYMFVSENSEAIGVDLPMIKSSDFSWERLWEIIEGMPLIILYYALTFGGAKVWAMVDNSSFLYALVPMWLTITLMALDEIYSLIRYMIVARTFKSQIADVISDEN